MEEWFLELQKPGWYPGDDIWTVINRFGSVVYTLVSIVFVIGFYKIVRKEWSWYIGIVFILNILSTFAVFPLMGEGSPAGLWRGAITITVAMISILGCLVWMYPRSKTLFGLLLPYTVWMIPITVLTWELLRLNT